MKKRVKLEWINVEKEMPEPNKRVVTLSKTIPKDDKFWKEERRVDISFVNTDGKWDNEYAGFNKITHWFPIPDYF